jgi:hypothetical protein
MIQDIKDLQSYNIVFLIYPSGASGEFLGYACMSSFENFAATNIHWENSSRMKFADCLGRSLNGADEVVQESLLLERFNQYCVMHNVDKKQTAVALVHPQKKILEWLQQWFSHAPMIEITTHTTKSQKFRDLAATEKIGPKIRNTHLYYDCGKQFDRHLKIEWQSLFLDSTDVEFQRLCGFLGHAGDFDQFNSLLQDYLKRNQHILDAISES